MIKKYFNVSYIATLFMLVMLSIFGSSEICRAQKFKKGEGSMTYAEYAPLSDKPVTLYYYVPKKGDMKSMPILFAMHGAKRDGKKTVGYWKELAEEYGFIVLAPEFSKKYYPQRAYQYGNVSKQEKDYDLNPQNEWTYNIIEAIFDFFCQTTGNLSDKYDIWGHSAGGQFVHRFLLCMPEARVNRAVAANPGTWTMIIGKNSAYPYGWPYSIKGTIFDSEEYLKPFFARDFYVSIGDKDIDTTSKYFPSYPQAMAQGPTRFARGKFFYSEARKTAFENHLDFRWRQVPVRGCGHTSKRMVYGRRKKVNGESVYEVGRLEYTGAFYLIYGDRFDVKVTK